MPRPTSGPRARLLTLALLLASSALLVPAAPAWADHQCSGVRNCVSVSLGPLTLSRSGSLERTVYCPSSAPNALGWAYDKSSSAVTVLVGFPDAGPSVSFTATNWSPIHRNSVTFYIGCSPTSSIPPPLYSHGVRCSSATRPVRSHHAAIPTRPAPL